MLLVFVKLSDLEDDALWRLSVSSDLHPSPDGLYVIAEATLHVPQSWDAASHWFRFFFGRGCLVEALYFPSGHK